MLFLKAVSFLVDVYANIFWIENGKEENKKEIQLFILKAAQLGKHF
jgi:hypothetical protein